jgi:hypothetical protein
MRRDRPARRAQGRSKKAPASSRDRGGHKGINRSFNSFSVITLSEYANVITITKIYIPARPKTESEIERADRSAVVTILIRHHLDRPVPIWNFCLPMSINQGRKVFSARKRAIIPCGTPGEVRAMQDPQALRNLARRCRNFATGWTAPPVARQLRLWAVELADEADEVERAAVRRARERMRRSRVTWRAGAPRSRTRSYHARFTSVKRDEMQWARDLREVAKRLIETSKRIVAECAAEISRAGELVNRARAACDRGR